MSTPTELLFAQVVDQIPADDYGEYEIPVPLGKNAATRKAKVELPNGFHYRVARPATEAELGVLPRRAHPQGEYVILSARRKVPAGTVYLVPKLITPAAEEPAKPF